MRFLFQKYQPKVSVLFTALLAVTFLLAGIMIWSAKGSLDNAQIHLQKKPVWVMHEDKTVRVESVSLGQVEARTGSGTSTEEFLAISVKYPYEKAISFVWEVANSGGPVVATANEKFVLVNIVSLPGNPVTDLYLVDRATKKVQHLEIKGKFLGITNDASRIVLRDNGAIIVKDTSTLSETQRRAFANQETVVASGVSQDGTRVAFMTWNGKNEASQKRNRVFVYDIASNKVIDMGLAAESADKFVWTDKKMFQSVMINHVDNSTQVVELFEMKEE